MYRLFARLLPENEEGLVSIMLVARLEARLCCLSYCLFFNPLANDSFPSFRFAR